MKIAWIGAGKMGPPVCHRLKAAGHEVSVLARQAYDAAAARGLGEQDFFVLVRDAGQAKG